MKKKMEMTTYPLNREVPEEAYITISDINTLKVSLELMMM